MADNNLRVLSIGVHGFSEDGFFGALRVAGVDLLCDIRFRRGLRGSLYRFANSTYLQKRLADLGIRYVHAKDLAPDETIRQHQWAEDRTSGIHKSQRTALSPAFVDAYQAQRMQEFDTMHFIRTIAPDVKAICFLCVERDPDACHRSLVGKRVAKDLGTTIEDLMP